MPIGDVFIPQGANLLERASAAENLRAQREQRGLRAQGLQLQRQQLQAQERQDQVDRINKQKAANFERAVSIMEHAPTNEIFLRSLQNAGSIIGQEIDIDKAIQQRSEIQKSIKNIRALSEKGQSQTALDLTNEIISGISKQLPESESQLQALTGIQKGLQTETAAQKERGRIGAGLFQREQIPAAEEEGIPITEPEAGAGTGITPTGQEIIDRFGKPAFEALARGDLEAFKELQITPEKPIIVRDVKGEKGKKQIQAIDPRTGAVAFTMDQFVPTKAPDLGKKGQVFWAKIEEDPEGIKPPRLVSKEVDTKGGRVTGLTASRLRRQGFEPLPVAKENLRTSLRMKPDEFEALFTELLGGRVRRGGGAAAGAQVPKAPEGALKFDSWFKVQQKSNPNLTRVDAMTEYIRQIEAR